MANFEDIVLAAIFFVFLCLCWYVWRKKKSITDSKSRFVHDTLAQARAQSEIFDLKLGSSGGTRSGISATLQGTDRSGLLFVADSPLPDIPGESAATAYFKVRVDGVPVFYTFDSQVRNVKTEGDESRLLLAMPSHLRVEKKRSFIRVTPPRAEIQAISVWPLEPGKRLPLTADELPSPLATFRQGKDPITLELENISATGLALRFFADNEGKFPVGAESGRQFICLVAYRPGADSQDRATAFWCTGEAMNARVAEAGGSALVLGLEFTNWAALKPGDKEIHWAHSSPSRGVKPILQWVEQIDRKEALQKQATGQSGA